MDSERLAVMRLRTEAHQYARASLASLFKLNVQEADLPALLQENHFPKFAADVGGPIFDVLPFLLAHVLRKPLFIYERDAAVVRVFRPGQWQMDELDRALPELRTGSSVALRLVRNGTHYDRAVPLPPASAETKVEDQLAQQLANVSLNDSEPAGASAKVASACVNVAAASASSSLASQPERDESGFERGNYPRRLLVGEGTFSYSEARLNKYAFNGQVPVGFIHRHGVRV